VADPVIEARDSAENSPAIFMRGGEPDSWVTVGELKSAEVCVSYMPSLKAKKLEKLTQEKTVLER
jgi:hypothetical protein